jgi:arabinogalactan oligomer / maltooligosaccharide transport system substrate-binding protein
MKLNNKIRMCLLLAPATLLVACGGGNKASSTAKDSGKASEASESASSTKDSGKASEASESASSTKDSGKASESASSTDTSGKETITIWCSETKGVTDSFKAIAEKYASDNNLDYAFNVVGVTEADSATQMLTDVSAGADIYCFAQDQFSRLVEGGALSKLGVKATEFVNTNNTSDSARAATSGQDCYAYPLTADNGYFMYYDKTVVSEDHLGSLEDIVKDCEDAGKKFSMETSTSAWYLASFFMAYDSEMNQLCHSNWSTNSKGEFTGVSDNWNSANGVIAAKGIQKLVKSDASNSSSDASELTAATPSAVLVSGTWSYKAAKEALGDKMGVAELPSFTVDGESYHMGSYSGYKLLGVRPCENATKLSNLHKIAQALTGYDAEVSRLNDFGWGPSNKAAQETDAYKNNPALVALAKQNVYSTAQGQIHGSWWDIAKVIGSSLITAVTDDEIKAVLQSYQNAIDALFQMSDEEKRAFTVIGNFATAPADDYVSWTSDLAMTENPTNTWTSPAITLTAGDEFKVRQGKNWDVGFGNGTGNYVVSADEAGSKKIQLVTTVDADGKVTNGTVTLLDA